jgi:arylsulfatase A-like enzyme
MVLVLMDDFSLDLLPTMRQARQMARDGASYRYSYVVDSLCCVSRASLLTGQYPHQTGVLTNTPNTPNDLGPIGGFEAYAAHGNAQRSVNVRLHEAGWTTGYVGKFLNRYFYRPGQPPPPVPPGWSDWQPVFRDAYDGWDFTVMEASADEVRVRHVAAPPARSSDEAKDAMYAGTVIADRAVAFIRNHRDDKAPFFLVVAPFATHSTIANEHHYPGDPDYPPAFADRRSAGDPGDCGPVSCLDLSVQDLPGFADDQADNTPRRTDGSPAAQWRPDAERPDPRAAAATLRTRAQMAQSVDRALARIRKAAGPGAYLLVTSDNGLHLGQHGLDSHKGSKGTPFASDVAVPLLVTGPSVVPGPRDAVVSNIDIAPTLEALAGLTPARFRSGTSLLPSLRDPAADRRRFAFFEHTWAPSLGFDPDANYSGATIDLIPSYLAVRSRTGLLVRFDLDPDWRDEAHAWEFYDYTRVEWERTNLYARPAYDRRIARLTRLLLRFEACHRFKGVDAVAARCRNLTR